MNGAHAYDLDEIYRVAVAGLRELDGRVRGNKDGRDSVVDKGAAQGICKECHATDNSFVLDTQQDILVCKHCGFVDPGPIQCEWDNSSRQLLLPGARMRMRKTVPYNHTYYFSEKMRCANGEGMFPLSFPFPCCS